MLRLVSLGLVAALFFSSTFVLNRAMSLGSGHWVWSGALRYGYMVLLLCLWLSLTAGPKAVPEALRAFRANFGFWLLAGTVGFGCFYAPLCYAAQFAPAWVVASTWLSTIVMALPVMRLFGKKVPKRGIFLSMVIFAGVLLVNLEHAKDAGLTTVLSSALPILLAAIAFPTGSQLVNEAKHGGHRWVPHIVNSTIEQASGRTLLLTLGSLPFWAVLVALTRPPAPTHEQWISTAVVALSSGVIATSIYLQARHGTTNPYEIAAIEATQGAETVFTLAGELLFLSAACPHLLGWSGIFLILLGLWLYSQPQPQTTRSIQH